MRLGVRLKLFFVFVGLIILIVAAVDWYATRKIFPTVSHGVRDDLLVRVGMMAADVATAPFALSDLADWDALADSLSRTAHARVTILRLDGTVIGDSEVELAALPSLESHADRPEVIGALEHGQGQAVRWSSTLREQMMYVAIPWSRQHEVRGVLRAAMPLTDVAHISGRFRAMLIAASAWAVGLAALASILAARRMSSSLRAVTAVAHRMTSGELTARCDVRGGDEVADLGRALNQLSGTLGQTIDRLRIEHELKDGIIQRMREGIILLDQEGRIALVNPALREQLPLGPEVIGRRPLEVIRNADLHGLFERALATGVDQTEEIEILGGRHPRLLVHAARFTGHGGGLLGVFVDVTELRRLETVRKDFVANVSHELRTPIATIGSATETLRDAFQRDPDAVATFLEIIERNTARMRNLVEDLLDLSRLEARGSDLQQRPLNLFAVVESMLSTFRPRATQKGIRLSAEMPVELPMVLAERSALDQVLTNLIDNALKYCGAGARVIIRATLEDGSIRIAVEDTGPGIEARHLPRLFERFYRVDEGRSRDLGGTGLGLSIVKHLVGAMNGTVTVTSTPGNGSTFAFTLPAA